MLPNGDIAPDFILPDSPDTLLSLSSLRGKKVVLAFYPADWSPVCGDQLVLYNEILELFESLNTKLIGISVDGKWCHASFRESRNLTFPLLADFEPKGNVSLAYRVYDETTGESCRALYLLDETGVILWSHLSPVDVNPGAEELLEILESLP